MYLCFLVDEKNVRNEQIVKFTVIVPVAQHSRMLTTLFSQDTMYPERTKKTSSLRIQCIRVCMKVPVT